MIDVNDFKIGLIYKYTSPSGKVYIGKTTDEKHRKQQHKNRTSKSKTHFGYAIRKYGFENFEYKVLIKFKPTLDIEKLERVLNKLERRYIKQYDCVKCGYNLTEGGEGALGYKHTEESIQKMRENTLNRPQEWHEKLTEAAIKRYEREGITDAQKEALKLGRIAGTDSPETRKKKSQAQNGKKKIVEQYDMEGNLLNTFESISAASKTEMDSKYKSTIKTKAKKIGECCAGRYKSIYGFVWKFK